MKSTAFSRRVRFAREFDRILEDKVGEHTGRSASAIRLRESGDAAMSAALVAGYNPGSIGELIYDYLAFGSTGLIMGAALGIYFEHPLSFSSAGTFAGPAIYRGYFALRDRLDSYKIALHDRKRMKSLRQRK